MRQTSQGARPHGSQRARRADQSPRGHAGLLDHQDPRHHARRDRRRHRVDDLARRDHARSRAGRAQRLSRRHGDLRRAAGRAGVGADQGAQVQPVALLGDHRRLDHRRHDAGRLRHPLARDRLSRRLAAAVRLRAAVAVRLVRTTGTISVNTVVSPREETFYWITITFSQTLGTALGDWIADSGLGYGGGALVFGAALLVLAALYFWTAHQPRAAVLGGVHPHPAARARRSATSSTSRSPRAGSTSAARSPRWCWRWRSWC